MIVDIHKEGHIMQGEVPATMQAVSELLRLQGIAATPAQCRAAAKALARLAPAADAAAAAAPGETSPAGAAIAAPASTAAAGALSCVPARRGGRP